MLKKPDFTVIDATITQSGKYIRVFGEYPGTTSSNGAPFKDNVLLEKPQFDNFAASPVQVGEGKTVQRVDGLVGAKITNVTLEAQPLKDEAGKYPEKPEFLHYLSEGTIMLSNGMSMPYKATIQHNKNKEAREDQEHAPAAAPGM